MKRTSTKNVTTADATVESNIEAPIVEEFVVSERTPEGESQCTCMECGVPLEDRLFAINESVRTHGMLQTLTVSGAISRTPYDITVHGPLDLVYEIRSLVRKWYDATRRDFESE